MLPLCKSLPKCDRPGLLEGEKKWWLQIIGVIQDIKNAFLERCPITNKSQPLPHVYKRDLAVIVNALWKTHEATKFIKTKVGSLEGRVSRVFKLWGQTEISVLQFLGVALGRGC